MRMHQFHQLIKHRQAISTKPFNARGSKVKRCDYCCVSVSHCICDHQFTADSQYAVLILVSDNEVMKPSNTGKLIADVVKETYVYQWHRTERPSSLISLLNSTDYAPVVVFPEQYVESKIRLLNGDAEMTQSSKTPLFIFLDGSWREARKMFNKSEYLHQFPVVSIRPDKVSEYLMRKSDNEAHLATAEVASLVFEQFGEPKTAKQLRLWFETFREAYLLSKTRLKPDHTRPALSQYLAYLNGSNS